MDRTVFYEQFKVYIRELCQNKELDFNDDDTFVHIGINSIEMVNVIIYIEMLIDRELPLEEYTLENLSSMKAIYENFIVGEM